MGNRYGRYKCIVCGKEFKWLDEVETNGHVFKAYTVGYGYPKCPSCGNMRDIKKVSGCFIATAVYGSSDHPKVLKLRDWRDDELQYSLFGRIFIKFYYSISPKLTGIINSNSNLKNVLRRTLDKLIDKIDKG